MEMQGIDSSGRRWWRFHSDVIKCDFVVCEVIPDVTWEIHCEDGVKYSASETAWLLSERDGGRQFELPLEVHLLKKMAAGQLVSIKTKNVVLPGWLVERSKRAQGEMNNAN